jgi:broad specificity phosphatase PhoE
MIHEVQNTQEAQAQPSRFYLVRHAQSEFNLAQMKALKTDSEVKVGEDLGVKFTYDLIDCSISEIGKEQAVKAFEVLKDINVTLVYSSPLRRCLATTYEIFKNHKNKPKVIVLPLIKEMSLSSCDISDELEVIKKEYPDYDFSLLEEYPHPELWLLYNLKNETMREELLEELFSKYRTKEEALKNAKYFLADKVKALYPNSLEAQIDINQRALETKKIMKDKLSNHPEGESIVVVTHSRFLESISAERYGEDGEPINAKWFYNCEVASFELE